MDNKSGNNDHSKQVSEVNVSVDSYQPSETTVKFNEIARHFNVISNTLVFTDGRDKSMKVIQYTLSVLMMTVLRKHNILTGLHKSIDGTMAMFSDARKVARLASFTSFFSKLVYLLQGRGLHPYQPLSAIDSNHYGLIVLKTASEFINGITDDLFCLAKFNIINKNLGNKAKEWSIKLWWTSLSIDFYLNLLKLSSTKKKLRAHSASSLLNDKEISEDGNKANAATTVELKAQIYGFQLTLVKIIADLIFCGYDLFHIKTHIEYMHMAGIVSGFVGYYRLWTKTSVLTKA